MKLNTTGTARVITLDNSNNGRKITAYISYNTVIAVQVNDKEIINGFYYSATTRKHLNLFLKYFTPRARTYYRLFLKDKKRLPIIDDKCSILNQSYCGWDLIQYYKETTEKNGKREGLNND